MNWTWEKEIVSYLSNTQRSGLKIRKCQILSSTLRKLNIYEPTNINSSCVMANHCTYSSDQNTQFLLDTDFTHDHWNLSYPLTVQISKCSKHLEYIFIRCRKITPRVQSYQALDEALRNQKNKQNKGISQMLVSKSCLLISIIELNNS